MTEPQWLDRENILVIHSDQIAEFGGLAGIRDPGAIESCLARPKHLRAYEDVDASFVSPRLTVSASLEITASTTATSASRLWLRLRFYILTGSSCFAGRRLARRFSSSWRRGT
jgi:hypothetical protein